MNFWNILFTITLKNCVTFFFKGKANGENSYCNSKKKKNAISCKYNFLNNCCSVTKKLITLLWEHSVTGKETEETLLELIR